MSDGDLISDTAIRKALKLAPIEPQQVELVHRNDGATSLGHAGTLFLEAWIAMLLLGGLHSTYPPVPAPGYWTVVQVLLLVATVGWAARGTRRTWNKR